MNHIHGTAVIGPGVEIGEGNTIGPYAVILGPCIMGDDNWIGPSAVIGTPGEVRGAAHPAAWLDAPDGGGITIGSRNIIREFTTVQASLVGRTVIGDDCYIMTKAHVPHDGVLGNRVTLACAALIGGHGQIGDGANLGLGAILHQRLVVGPGAMVGMGAVVTKDVPPHSTVFGSPARVRSVNHVGMTRRGMSAELASDLASTYGTGEVFAPGDARIPAQLRGDFAWYHQAQAHRDGQ